MDPAAAKQELRRAFGRQDPPARDEAESAGERISALLLAEPAIARAERVALYSALADEVPTRSLFDALVRDGRTCLFPRALPTGRLVFTRVENIGNLRPGRYGIAEPPEGTEVRLDQTDIVIVPGVAFDRCGTRLGRGAGCYDRTFPPNGLRQPCLVGATFAARIVQSLPHGSHDRVMDAIVTEQEFCWTRGI